jgi:anthranilate synthase component I
MLELSTREVLAMSRINLIPVKREMPADLETPVSIYLKLAGNGPSFLLESVTGGEQVARYSFIGVQPRKVYLLCGHQVHVIEEGQTRSLDVSQQTGFLDLLHAEMAAFSYQNQPGLPRLVGGLVGYLGYDVIPQFEPGVSLPPANAETLPDAVFLLVDTLVAFDHAYGKLVLIANAQVDVDEAAAIQAAEDRLDVLQARLNRPLPAPATRLPAVTSAELFSNTTQDEFLAAVLDAKEHILRGDIFQVVLSQCLSRQTNANAFDIYRALRRLNPSPYMFFFDFDRLAGTEPFYLIGASPEMHVRLEDDVAVLRPIAGTRRRGVTPEMDIRQAEDLLADPKERAEHVMLVDLARNDLGRVCEYGSVQVEEMMVVERYSHVMHIVSQVVGRIRPGVSAFDLLRVTFPAGTVSGAPKIRAMQLITALEKDRRGPYAGAVGYFSFDGTMDTCITIRTLVKRGNTVTIQSGAGIVADSEPVSEYEETLNKALALAVAVENAERSL